ncbi:band 4.1-like protein 3a isoform X5 [Tachysurus fulvidraco]|uniref:band 4.1-like protein 3a isoform X5 n=1 Tax=Tachysurus fulvidraco TaxID=1234273 RepID=UPI001FEE9D19|nr:band 4.1-like protein 3a isoform X5 [Tachysurus fulvidraco]
MTTEPNSELDGKPEQQGSGAAPPHTAPPIDDQLPPAAAHSTPVKKEQNGAREVGGAAQGKTDQQSTEDESTPYKSTSSKLSRSPIKVAKKPKNMQCKITLLDGSDYTCVVEKRDKGQVIFDKVCEHLNLLEKDYFGITFRDVENQKNWLDPAKDMKKQIRGVAWNFSFNVKFYPPDPAQLSEDITRYYLCLQLRDDVASGRLPCSFATHTVLGSYTIQSELGDYDPDEYSTNYVSEFHFAPNQTKELEEKVMELHKTYKGMTPAEAEMHFLENVKKLSMYGVDLHHAKLVGSFFECLSPAKGEDSEGVEIMLGVCSSGLLIYRDRLRINRFAWPKVLKISYKRNNFYIKIRPGEFEQFESTIGFKLPNHRAAKRLWKVCVEHHTFFRLVSPETPPKKFLTLGSKFRYSGRTQVQTRRASSQIVRPAPFFERSTSKRYIMSRSLDGAQRSIPQITATVVPGSIPLIAMNGTKPAEMGTALYGAAKGIAMSDLITTITPEKKAEEKRSEEDEVLLVENIVVEEEDETTKATEVSQPSPLSPVQLDTRTDFTDTAIDGELTATEQSDQEDESEIRIQPSFIRRIKGENVFIRHSKLMLEEVDKTPEELVKHQTNISELKRTFLEGGTNKSGLTEWEKRLSSSPLRSPRLDEAPMIEPLVPEDTKEDSVAVAEKVEIARGTEQLDSQDDRKDDVESDGWVIINKVPPKPKPTFDEMSPELTALLKSAHEHISTWSSSSTTTGQTGAILKTSTRSERTEQQADTQKLPEKDQPREEEQADEPQQYTVSKKSQVEALTFPDVLEPGVSKITYDEPSSSVHVSDHSTSDKASSDSSSMATAEFNMPISSMGIALSSMTTRPLSPSDSESGDESFSLSTDDDDPASGDQSPNMTLCSTIILSEQTGDAEGHSKEVSSLLQTGVITFSSALSDEMERLDSEEMPVIHTEMKTITYEALKGDTEGDTEPGILMSAQTITSETTSTTTTTHITKTVKGSVSETRIEKRIVISGDADIDHDEAIKEAKEQHPDMSVTKVVVHKETEITPEDGEE